MITQGQWIEYEERMMAADKKVESLEQELELKDSWVKHHQRACEIAMSDRTKTEQKLKIAVEALEKASSRFELYEEEIGNNFYDDVNIVLNKLNGK